MLPARRALRCYAIHDHRYFSAELPTKLVRDGGHEPYDPPPDVPLPDGELVPVVEDKQEACIVWPAQAASGGLRLVRMTPP
jgi:hypothetical protein